MLKKAVTGSIRPATRRCKCGIVGNINPTADITYCGHCNELLFKEVIPIKPVKKVSKKDDKKEAKKEESLDESTTSPTGDPGAEQADLKLDFDK